MEAHFLDLILCVPLLWGLIRGAMRGLVFEIAILVALALGLWGGFALAGFASVYLSEYFHVTGNTLHYLSFFIVFFLIVLLIILLGKLLSTAVSIAGLGIFNRMGGAVFGLAKWILISAAVLWLIKPIDEQWQIIPTPKKESSYLFKPMMWLGKTMIPENLNQRITHPKELL